MLRLRSVEFGVQYLYGTTQTTSIQKAREDLQGRFIDQEEKTRKGRKAGARARETVRGTDAQAERNSKTGVPRKYQPRHRPTPGHQRAHR